MIKDTGYPKKNSDTVHFCISQDGYPKRASQDYTNDVRINISTSLNFAQIRKNAPKTTKLQLLESAQPAPKKIGCTEKIVHLEKETSGLSTGYARI